MEDEQQLIVGWLLEFACHNNMFKVLHLCSKRSMSTTDPEKSHYKSISAQMLSAKSGGVMRVRFMLATLRMVMTSEDAQDYEMALNLIHCLYDATAEKVPYKVFSKCETGLKILILFHHLRKHSTRVISLLNHYYPHIYIPHPHMPQQYKKKMSDTQKGFRAFFLTLLKDTKSGDAYFDENRFEEDFGENFCANLKKQMADFIGRVGELLPKPFLIKLKNYPNTLRDLKAMDSPLLNKVVECIAKQGELQEEDVKSLLTEILDDTSSPESEAVIEVTKKEAQDPLTALASNTLHQETTDPGRSPQKEVKQTSALVQPTQLTPTKRKREASLIVVKSPSKRQRQEFSSTVEQHMSVLVSATPEKGVTREICSEKEGDIQVLPPSPKNVCSTSLREGLGMNPTTTTSPMKKANTSPTRKQPSPSCTLSARIDAEPSQIKPSTSTSIMNAATSGQIQKKQIFTGKERFALVSATKVKNDSEESAELTPCTARRKKMELFNQRLNQLKNRMCILSKSTLETQSSCSTDSENIQITGASTLKNAESSRSNSENSHMINSSSEKTASSNSNSEGYKADVSSSASGSYKSSEENHESQVKPSAFSGEVCSLDLASSGIERKENDQPANEGSPKAKKSQIKANVMAAQKNGESETTKRQSPNDEVLPDLSPAEHVKQKETSTTVGSPVEKQSQDPTTTQVAIELVSGKEVQNLGSLDEPFYSMKTRSSSSDDMFSPSDEHIPSSDGKKSSDYKGINVRKNVSKMSAGSTVVSCGSPSKATSASPSRGAIRSPMKALFIPSVDRNENMDSGKSLMASVRSKGSAMSLSGIATSPRMTNKGHILSELPQSLSPAIEQFASAPMSLDNSKESADEWFSFTDETDAVKCKTPIQEPVRTQRLSHHNAAQEESVSGVEHTCLVKLYASKYKGFTQTIYM